MPMLAFRVSKEEEEAIRKIAGGCVSEWIRKVLIAGGKKKNGRPKGSPTRNRRVKYREQDGVLFLQRSPDIHWLCACGLMNTGAKCKRCSDGDNGVGDNGNGDEPVEVFSEEFGVEGEESGDEP